MKWRMKRDKGQERKEKKMRTGRRHRKGRKNEQTIKHNNNIQHEYIRHEKIKTEIEKDIKIQN